MLLEHDWPLDARGVSFPPLIAGSVCTIAKNTQLMIPSVDISTIKAVRTAQMNTDSLYQHMYM